MASEIQRLLGRLEQQLSDFVPRFEAHVREFSSLKEKFSGLSNDVANIKRKNESDVIKVKDRLKEGDGDFDTLKDKIQILENDLARRQSGKTKLWDIAKILLTAGIGAIVALLMKKWGFA